MKQTTAIFLAIGAATLYAFNSPISKLLLQEIPATMMAAFLYLGAGLGIAVLRIFQKKSGTSQEHHLTKQEFPYTIGMVLLDIAAPIFLMIGLTMTTSANASLLNNFEIVATSVIALCIFKEVISKRLWLAIFLLTFSSILLSVEDIKSLSLSLGSIFVLGACICWGFENNCTRMLSSKNPLEIVIIKGFGSGIGSLCIALFLGERYTNFSYILIALLLGFVAYGLSILLYIYAQRYLGAAKTSTYYAVSPFIGVLLSFLIFRQPPTPLFLIAFGIMLAGTFLAATDSCAASTEKVQQ